MFLLERAKIVVQYGDEQAPFITVEGRGYQSSPVPLIRKSPQAKKQAQKCLLAVECSCEDQTGNTDLGDSSSDRLFADMFYKQFVLAKGSDTEDSFDDNPTLDDLLLACQKLTLDVKNSGHAKSVARLARTYRGEEQITQRQCHSVEDFLTCQFTVIQMAMLTALSKLFSRADNVHCLISHCPRVLDCVLLLLSDCSVQEIQISALIVLEKAVCSSEVIKTWRYRLEDTIFPIITNKMFSEKLKLSCMRVMRNLSQHHVLSARVAHEVLSQLSCVPNSSGIKELCLEILLECFKTSKKEISADVLERNLFPMLTVMLASGPCKSQWQSLQLLTCVSQDEEGKAKTLAAPETVAVCILCLKLSKCRIVKIYSCQFIRSILDCITISQAKQFMKCISEGRESDSRQIRKKENRISSPNGKLPKLWKYFDAFIDQLVSQLETEGHIYSENSADLSCGLNLVESSSRDQLSAIVSLIECFNSLCMWPLQRLGKSDGHIGSVGDNAGLNSLQFKLSRLNHHHVIFIWGKVGVQILVLFKKVAKQLLSLTVVQPEQQCLSLDITQATHQKLSVNTSSENSQITDQVMESIQQQDNPAILIQNLQENSSSVSASIEEDYPLAVSKVTCSHVSVDHNSNLKSFTIKEDKSNSNIHAVQEYSSNSTIHSKSLESLSQMEIKLLKDLVTFVFILSVVACHSKKVTKLDGHNSLSGSHDIKIKENLAKNDIAAERTLLRHFLMKEDIFPLLAQLADLEDDDIKTMCFTVLRLFLRPVGDEPVVASPRRSKSVKLLSARHVRQSVDKSQANYSKAGHSQKYLSSNLDVDLDYSTKLDSEFSRGNSMFHWTERSHPSSCKNSAYVFSRPASANMFTSTTPFDKKEHITPKYLEVLALPAQPHILSAHTSQRPVQLQNQSQRTGWGRTYLDFKHSIDLRPESAHGNLNFGSEIVTDPVRLSLGRRNDSPLQAKFNVPRESGQQHSKLSLVESGKTALSDIFSPNLNVRKSSLLFLHDLVEHSQKEFHMELSKHGCMPKLLDFLRINDEDELSLITGLTIARMLILSDHRLCQLFHIHGGPSLLMDISHRQPSQELRQAVASTFAAINKVIHTAVKQDSSCGHSGEAADIWGKIMHRWEGEDNVVKILTQFL